MPIETGCGRTPGVTVLDRAAEAEGISLFAHGGDAEGDVFVERDAEFLDAFDYVFAADAAGKGFVFHSFFDRADFKIEDAFGRTDVSAGGEKAGKFVAGEQRVLESSLAGRHRSIPRGREWRESSSSL